MLQKLNIYKFLPFLNLSEVYKKMNILPSESVLWATVYFNRMKSII